MRVFPNLKPILRLAVAATDMQTRVTSRANCSDIYDGANLPAFAAAQGGADVLLIAPPMADREGALIHPGIQILQTILRSRSVRCEVLNYNLPVAHPAEPYEHLSLSIRTLGVKVVGISLYSQAIKTTMRGLAWIKARHPDLVIVLGGPHPTEAYLSLLGLSFVDYVVRSEAEESFPALVEAILAGRVGPGTIAGVYSLNRERNQIVGRNASFIDVQDHDRRGLLRYNLRDSEMVQYRRYRGAHGLCGPRYWPTSLVRGCPYACTYCAAKIMSGKRLRYRDIQAVADELEHYRNAYGQRHFSFVDDSFTQDYGYVRDLCAELIKRKLDIEWTTDNGIRYESLGPSQRVQRFLQVSGMPDMRTIMNIMFDAGWRGTSIGIESGAERVRRDLVRKGGKLLKNEEIVAALRALKEAASARGIDFYVNGYLMVGFPPLTLPNGHRIEGESTEEASETVAFALQLQRAGALDFVNLSIVIPLPGTDMWDHLNIEQRMRILVAGVPTGHREAAALAGIVQAVLESELDLTATPYTEEAELAFWRGVYRLSDDMQIEINGAYDAFNADAAYQISLDRPDGNDLFALRQTLLEAFYGGIRNELKLMRHILRRCEGVRDFMVYFSYFCRTYLPNMKRINVPQTADRIGA